MTIRRGLSTLAAVLALGPAAAFAAPPATPDAQGSRLLQRYDDTLQVRVNTRDASGYVLLKLKAVAKVWTLMGEPVVYCSAAWSLGGSTLKIEHRGESQFLNVLNPPREVLDAIDLVEAKVAFPVYRKGQSWRETPQAWVPCDLGALNGNGDPDGSFNVPGSPNWDRFLLKRVLHDTLPWDAPVNFMPAADAKALLASGQYEFRPGENGRISDGAALHFEFNLWPVRQWLDRQHTKREADKRAERQRQHEAYRRSMAVGSAAASASASAGVADDPFEQMVQEVETTTAARASRAEAEGHEQERRQAAATRSRHLRVLAQRSCVQGKAGPVADLAAAAEQAEAAHERCNDLAGVQAFRDDKTRLWGYKRANGSVMIDARYEAAARAFSEGMARVSGGDCPKDRTCFISPAGAILLDTGYEARDFVGGLAVIQAGRRYGYMDRSGRVVVPVDRWSASDLSDGLGRVTGGSCRSDHTCYVDAAGKEVLSVPYDAGSFSDGMATAHVFNKAELRGYIDRSGRLVVPLRYGYVASFKNGLGRVEGKACPGKHTCYVDASGNEVLRAPYAPAGDFNEGLASARGDNNRYGFIDRSGRMVIEARYFSEGTFKDGRARVSVFLRTEELGDRCRNGWYSFYSDGEIDREGRWVSGPTERRSHDKTICLTAR